jgi:acetyltransferase-like isoleucine patch superfamily enzyme
MTTKKHFIHPTADVSPKTTIGTGTSIWHQAQVRDHASIGNHCIIGKGTYIDKGVKIGNNCKLQNYSCIYHGTTLKDGVFIGPGAKILNDKYPRAITPSGNLKSDSDWQVSPVTIHKGASIGAGSLILPGVKIGKFALIGAGSVVTNNIPDHALAYGNPAQVVGQVNQAGQKT